MLHHLRQWLADLLQSPDQATAAQAETSGVRGGDGALVEERSRRLAGESELQRLRLELAHANQRLGQAEAELQRQSREEAGILQHHLEVQLEKLVAPLATPLTQLLTQQHLIEQEGKELDAKDLLATSRRLWQGLAPTGVEVLEAVGAVVSFDPDRHQPLGLGSLVEAGTPVRVRIPGLLLKGQVLKTASVEPLTGTSRAPLKPSPPAPDW
jgi:molecular chaperone GrpE (heat shock protein)